MGGVCCGAKKGLPSVPGSALDRVISQQDPDQDNCLLYKLANYKRGNKKSINEFFL
jgi:hypothetical protein